MARRSTKKSNSVKVNFKGVESRRTPAEGDYPMKVLEAKAGESGAGNDQIEFVCEISSGEYQGVKAYLYCPLSEKSLWKLHAFLTALGQEVPEDEMDIDLSELIDLEFMGVLTHETYNGRKQAKLTDFDTIDNYEAPKASKGKSKKADADEDEDEDDDKASKKSKGKAAKGKKAKPADDEDEEEEKTSKKSKAGKGKKKKTWSEEDLEDMDEDELQAVLDEAGLDDDVDLDDFKKLPKKVAAVTKALKGAKLLAD